MAYIRKGRKQREAPNSLNYIVSALWILFLLGWLYLIHVLIINDN